jgi:MoxR-like ATPase
VRALLEGRNYLIPEDVKRLAIAVFGLRVLVNSRAVLSIARSHAGDQIVKEILTQVEAPIQSPYNQVRRV